METDEQIEEWFEKEKERLSEEHLEAIEHGKTLQKAKDQFDRQMKKLLKEYEDRHEKMWASQDRHEKLHRPVDEMSRKFSIIKKEYDEWYEDWKKSMHDHWEDAMEDADKKKLDLELKWHRILKEWRDKLHHR